MNEKLITYVLITISFLGLFLGTASLFFAESLIFWAFGMGISAATSLINLYRFATEAA